MVETRGHNDDSMSLILDSGLAFNDDLPLPAYAGLENYQTTFDCRARLAAHKAQLIYPGYAHPKASTWPSKYLIGPHGFYVPAALPISA